MATKIIHVSDTHLRPFIPQKGDILVHSGDALKTGSFEELPQFRKQLEDIKNNYSYIIYVPGNHDWCFQHNYKGSISFLKETIENIHVLHNDSIILNGLKFYGTADQPNFYDWAFNKSTEELIQSYSNIPDDTQVLITHCPPKGVLDYVMNSWNPDGANVGSLELVNELSRLKQLKAHLFGHIHFSKGLKVGNNVTYSNAAICDERYQPTNKENVVLINE